MTLRRKVSWCRLLGLALLFLLTRLAHAEEPRPLTTTILREMALAAGIGKGLTGVQLNRAIGLAFQDVALRAFNQPENKDPFDSPLRARATQKLTASWQSVVPDGVRTAILLPKGRPPARLFPNSVFFEAKATRYPLTLASRNWQILGLLDAAARSPGGRARVGASVYFLTTADTEIAPEVAATAELLQVIVWQRKAYVLADGSIQFGSPAPLGPPLQGKTMHMPRPDILNWSKPLRLQQGLPPSTRLEPTELDEK